MVDCTLKLKDKCKKAIWSIALVAQISYLFEAIFSIWSGNLVIVLVGLQLGPAWKEKHY